MAKVVGFDELWGDEGAVVGGVSGDVGDHAIVVGESYKAGVFYAVFFFEGDWEYDTFGDFGGEWECQFVAGVGDSKYVVLNFFSFYIGADLSQGAFENDFHFFVGEGVVELIEDGGTDVFGQGHLGQQFAEDHFAIAVGFDEEAFGDELAGGLNVEQAIGIEDAFAKYDGGKVAFAGGAEADDDIELVCGSV